MQIRNHSQPKPRERAHESGRADPARGAGVGDLLSPSHLEDPEAFSAVYDCHHDELLRHALSVLHSGELAEDAVQQAFVNTIAVLSGGREIEHGTRWLHRCVHNACMDRLREPRDEQIDAAVGVAGAASLPDTVDTRERCRAVEKAVSQLPDHLRSAFLLADVRGLDYQEIAEKMERSVASVRQLIFRARDHVRRAVGPRDAALASLLLVRSGGGGASGAGHWWLEVEERVGAMLSWLASTAERVSQMVSQPALTVAAGVLAAAAIVSTQMLDGNGFGDRTYREGVGRSIQAIDRRGGVEGLEGTQRDSTLPSLVPGQLPGSRGPGSRLDRHHGTGDSSGSTSSTDESSATKDVATQAAVGGGGKDTETTFSGVQAIDPVYEEHQYPGGPGGGGGGLPPPFGRIYALIKSDAFKHWARSDQGQQALGMVAGAIRAFGRLPDTIAELSVLASYERVRVAYRRARRIVTKRRAGRNPAGRKPGDGRQVAVASERPAVMPSGHGESVGSPKGSGERDRSARRRTETSDSGIARQVKTDGEDDQDTVPVATGLPPSPGYQPPASEQKTEPSSSTEESPAGGPVGQPAPEPEVAASPTIIEPVAREPVPRGPGTGYAR